MSKEKASLPSKGGFLHSETLSCHFFMQTLLFARNIQLKGSKAPLSEGFGEASFLITVHIDHIIDRIISQGFCFLQI